MPNKSTICDYRGEGAIVEFKSNPKIEIGELIDQRSLSALQIIVIVMSALVVWLDGYHIQSMALVVPSLASQWSMKSSDFSLVLASALVGIALGGAFLAPLGDRRGRRMLLIASMAVVGLSSIATGYATGMTHLIVWRFLTGLGLGASIPNATALTSDYVPAKRRAALVTVMFSGIAIGAFTSGFVAPPIIAAFGWQGMFTIGGVLPLVLSVLLAATIPESIRLLVVRAPDDPRIPKILARLAPGIDPRAIYAKKQEVQRQSVIELLRGPYRKGTLLLWLVFVLNMFILYLLVNWLPSLLTAQGWPSSQALQGAVMIQAGGVMGGLLLSWYVDKGKTVAAMISAYSVTALAFGLFVILPSNGASWWILLLVVGGGISGGQFALNALAATYYPPIIRATGVGWAYSIGRIGAIVSPVVGGWILQMQVAPFAVMGMMVVPVVLCAAGVLMFRNTFQAAPAATTPVK
jgi:AAHS family 4-hydroxybenzoate transporter-like MFS transporter